MKVRIISALLVLVLGLGALWMMHLHNTEVERQVGEMERGGVDPDAPEPFEVIREIDRLKFKDPAKALELAERAASESGNEAERHQAAERVRNCKHILFQRTLRDGSFEKAQALYQEIVKSYPGTSESRSVKNEWASHAEKQANQAAERGDTPEAERWFSLVMDDPAQFDSTFLFNSYIKFKIEQLQRARDAGDAQAAKSHFLDAASLYASWNQPYPVMQAVPAVYPPEAVEPAADELFAGGNPSAAVCLYNSASNRPKKGPDADQVRERLRGKIDQCWLVLAHLAESGALQGADVEKARSFYQQVRSDEPAIRLERDQGLLTLELNKARSEIAEEKFSQAEQSLQKVLRQLAPQVWADKVLDPSYDYRADVPAELLAEIEQAAGNSEENRRVQLANKARQGAFPVPLPEAAEAANLLPETSLSKTLANLDEGHYRSAYGPLRTILRNDPQSASSKRIIQALQNALWKIQAKKDFNNLLDMTGFYVAEVGVPSPGDPFRQRLKGIIDKAIEHFSEKSEMKHIFLLSLKADVFADEPAGDSARKQAMKLGVESVSKRASKETSDKKGIGPSSIPGCTVESIDNATSYHLLVFFHEGPEEFFVRFNPYRRASLVLKNGKYVRSVIVTADEVVPYQSEYLCNSEHLTSLYHIKHSGPGAWNPPPGQIGGGAGPYTLMRAPEGVGPLKIDPDTGMVTPSE